MNKKGENYMIVIAGMIGGGKSSLAEIIGEQYKSDVFFESVKDNKILPLFYTASKEDMEKYRYPFLLQLWFLNTRFADIKRALIENNNVLDRSIYEDLYFATVNHRLGRISDLEFEIYEKLLTNMMQELDELPKKAPDLLVYLKGSFETFISRIENRGRSYEAIDPESREYFHTLWEGYDEWLEKHYKFSDVVVVDIDNTDYVNNEKDRNRVLEAIDKKLKEVRKPKENIVEMKILLEEEIDPSKDVDNVLIEVLDQHNKEYCIEIEKIVTEALNMDVVKVEAGVR